MELTINNKDLARVLGSAKNIASKKSSIGSLTSALIEAGADRLTVRATDLFMGVETGAAAKTKTPGSIAVNAALAHSIADKLPAGDVTLKLAKTQLEIKAGKSKFKLPTVDASDFPELPTSKDAKRVAVVEGREMSRALGQASYAWATDETRPHLCGALFEFEAGKSARIATTDGHRLAVAYFHAPESATQNLLIPGRGVSELRKLCDATKDGNVTISTFGGVVFFAAGDVVVSAKLVQEAFPPYQKIVPIRHKHSVTLRKDMLLDAVRRVSLVASDKGGGIRLTFAPGSLTLWAENADAGEGQDVLECDAGFEMVVGINHRFLSEACAAVLDDELRLELSDALDPVVVVPATTLECKGVVMPMRT